MRKKKVDEKILEKYVDRISYPTDKETVREILRELVMNNAIPLELLKDVPYPVRKVGKTRFDQLYDIAMSLVFPEYRETTLERLLGTNEIDTDVKIFRICFPDKYNISHILIRATTYQQAFALGCDYACRVSLKLFKRIPTDLTIRVIFVSESALRRHLSLREINKYKKRKETKVEGREFTDKQLAGARLAALGNPKNPNHSIFKYMEYRDLRRIRESKSKARISSVESESFKRTRYRPMDEHGNARK